AVIDPPAHVLHAVLGLGERSDARVWKRLGAHDHRELGHPEEDLVQVAIGTEVMRHGGHLLARPPLAIHPIPSAAYLRYDTGLGATAIRVRLPRRDPAHDRGRKLVLLDGMGAVSIVGVVTPKLGV